MSHASGAAALNAVADSEGSPIALRSAPSARKKSPEPYRLRMQKSLHVPFPAARRWRPRGSPRRIHEYSTRK